MTKFIEVPANKMSLSLRKPVCGVGVNDADYKITGLVNGKWSVCPINRIWRNMLRRCYSEDYQKRQPTYRGCSVASEWLLFSNFRGWMIDQDYEGKQLDKDIIKSGNKIYSAETCIFVSVDINNLLTAAKSSKGGCSVGVSLNRGRYVAQCAINGISTHVGQFDTDKEASEAYLAFKSRRVLEIASKQDNPLKGHLARISKEIASGEYFK